MKHNSQPKGSFGRAWNSPSQVNRRQMVALAVIVSFPTIVLPSCFSYWRDPSPSFDRWMIALGYTFSIFSAVAFVATAGRWAFWCAIDILVSWWDKSHESKDKLPWRRPSTSTTWWRL